jgi:hypothetical protein
MSNKPDDGSKPDALARVLSGQSWDEFCDTLKDAKRFILRPEAPGGEVDRAEGFRHLTRLARISLEQMLEGSDPQFPLLFRAITPTQKYGGDSPDNVYHNATVRGDREYVIRGKMGNAVYFSIGSKANRYFIDGSMASTGEIDCKNLVLDQDGCFEIRLSQKQQPGNWLPMQPDTTMLVVRQMMADWRRDTPATLSIECLDGPKSPRPLSAALLDQGLAAAAAYVSGCAKTFSDFSEILKDRIPLNTLDGSLQEFFRRAGGDPNIFYLQGYWRLAADEALVLESDVPECLFWNFQLDNYWMESLDYRYLSVALNNFNARYEADGRLKIVIAARDPGTGNFIDTCGHVEGGMIIRWVHAKTHPEPQCRVVKLDSLRS